MTPQPTTLLGKLKLNFGFVYSKLVKVAADGGQVQLVTEEIFHARIDTCHGCDRLFHETLQCKECGCSIHIKAAVLRDPFTNSKIKCPLRKWKN